jgi:hypothetical protein
VRARISGHRALAFLPFSESGLGPSPDCSKVVPDLDALKFIEFPSPRDAGVVSPQLSGLASFRSLVVCRLVLRDESYVRPERRYSEAMPDNYI